MITAKNIALCEDFLGYALIEVSFFADLLPSPEPEWTRLQQARVRDIHAPHTVRIDIDPNGDGWVRNTSASLQRVYYTAGLVKTKADLPPAIAQATQLIENPSTRAHAEALLRPLRQLKIGIAA